MALLNQRAPFALVGWQHVLDLYTVPLLWNFGPAPEKSKTCLDTIQHESVDPRYDPYWYKLHRYGRSGLMTKLQVLFSSFGGK